MMQTMVFVCLGWVIGDAMHGRFDGKIMAFTASVLLAHWLITRRAKRR